VTISSRGIACALVLALANQGCGTAVGFGIGAVVDATSERKYEARRPSEARSLESGKDVILRTKHGEALPGELVGIARRAPNETESRLVIESARGIDVVGESELDRIDVAKPKKGRLVGAVVGLGVDVTLLTLLVVVAATWSGSMGSSSYQGGAGSGW
jgi:hypothetical protein